MFWTICNKFTEELKNQLSDKDNKYISDLQISDLIEELKNVNSYSALLKTEWRGSLILKYLKMCKLNLKKFLKS